MDHQSTNDTPKSETSPLLLSSSSINNNGNTKIIHNATTTTGIPASLYVISGVTQPLLMTICKSAGLADPDCQLYMLFYYLGPASVGLHMWWSSSSSSSSSSSESSEYNNINDNDPRSNNNHNNNGATLLPSLAMMSRAGFITVFDICAQAMNYTGAALAGPTIFAIVYSSVTVWTAVFSRVLLQRKLLLGQWLGIAIVFCGLAITATDHSVQVGSNVSHGLILVLIGSMMHGLTYVMCEVVMVVCDDALESMPTLLRKLVGDKNEQRMTVVQNCAIQGIFAVTFMLVWQLLYTVPHWEELIVEPMQQAGTSISTGILILTAFAVANLIHALSYFFTLRHFPGGATSAGVMKGLQAVLVFVVTHLAFCGRTGGTEMCFSPTKFVSLCTVVGGVGLFGVYTEQQHRSTSTTRSTTRTTTKQQQEPADETQPTTNPVQSV